MRLQDLKISIKIMGAIVVLALVVAGGTAFTAHEMQSIDSAYSTFLERDTQSRFDAAKLRALLPVTVDVAAVDHWWLCGPFGLVEDAIGLLTEFDVPRRRIHRELFYVEDAPPAPATHAPHAVQRALTPRERCSMARIRSVSSARRTPPAATSVS